MKLLLPALIAFITPASAAHYTLELAPGTTKIQWTLNDVLHTVHGTFDLKRGLIGFDTGTRKAAGEVVVAVATGHSGSEARDHRMQANVLESSKFPEAVFIPDRLDAPLAIPGDSTVALHGTLTIHGTSHELVMEVHAHTTTTRVNANLAFDMPYVSWGMKDPSNLLLKVAKTVRVSIETDAELQAR